MLDKSSGGWANLGCARSNGSRVDSSWEITSEEASGTPGLLADQEGGRAGEIGRTCGRVLMSIREIARILLQASLTEIRRRTGGRRYSPGFDPWVFEESSEDNPG